MRDPSRQNKRPRGAVKKAHQEKPQDRFQQQGQSVQRTGRSPISNYIRQYYPQSLQQDVSTALRDTGHVSMKASKCPRISNSLLVRHICEYADAAERGQLMSPLAVQSSRTAHTKKRSTCVNQDNLTADFQHREGISQPTIMGAHDRFPFRQTELCKDKCSSRRDEVARSDARDTRQNYDLSCQEVDPEGNVNELGTTVNGNNRNLPRVARGGGMCDSNNQKLAETDPMWRSNDFSKGGTEGKCEDEVLTSVCAGLDHATKLLPPLRTRLDWNAFGSQSQIEPHSLCSGICSSCIDNQCAKYVLEEIESNSRNDVELQDFLTEKLADEAVANNSHRFTVPLDEIHVQCFGSSVIRSRIQAFSSKTKSAAVDTGAVVNDTESRKKYKKTVFETPSDTEKFPRADDEDSREHIFGPAKAQKPLSPCKSLGSIIENVPHCGSDKSLRLEWLRIQIHLFQKSIDEKKRAPYYASHRMLPSHSRRSIMGNASPQKTPVQIAHNCQGENNDISPRAITQNGLTSPSNILSEEHHFDSTNQDDRWADVNSNKAKILSCITLRDSILTAKEFSDATTNQESALVRRSQARSQSANRASKLTEESQTQGKAFRHRDLASHDEGHKAEKGASLFANANMRGTFIKNDKTNGISGRSHSPRKASKSSNLHGLGKYGTPDDPLIKLAKDFKSLPKREARMGRDLGSAEDQVPSSARAKSGLQETVEDVPKSCQHKANTGKKRKFSYIPSTGYHD